MQTLSVLIPVYNEQAYLTRLVERVQAVRLPHDLQKELVVVNDASTDRTPQVIQELCERFPNIKAFDQPMNRGKGAAIRRAVDEMTGDFAIIQDADLEYDPEEYPQILRPLLDGHADVVYGSRFASREMRKVLFYHHKLGNYLLTFLSNLATGLDLTDMETCYKAFRGQVLKSIPLRSNRFGIEPEITAKVAKRGLSVYEVPISYHGRKYSEGKKIGWKDGVSAIWTIAKYWFLDDYAKESDALQVRNSPDSLRRYYQDIVRRSLPYLGNRIMEVDSHTGLISRLLPQREKLYVSDRRNECVAFLENLYDGNAVVEVLRFDPEGDEPLPPLDPDTILYVHGLQKTENEKATLDRIFEILRPGGKFILAVPQYPSLFSSLDRELGYRRRYARKDIGRLLREAGFRVLSCKGVHTAAFFAWYVNGVLLGRKKLGKVQLKILNAMFPLSGWLPLPGADLFIVVEKPDV